MVRGGCVYYISSLSLYYAPQTKNKAPTTPHTSNRTITAPSESRFDVNSGCTSQP